VTEGEFRDGCTGLLEQLAARDPARFFTELVAWCRRQFAGEVSDAFSRDGSSSLEPF
jgi:hypothetical protein